MIIDWSANKYQQGFLCLGGAIPVQAYITSRVVSEYFLYSISVKVLPEISLDCKTLPETNISCKTGVETNIGTIIVGGI